MGWGAAPPHTPHTLHTPAHPPHTHPTPHHPHTPHTPPTPPSPRSEEMASSGQCLDVFICALDQIGLLEMKPCAEKTGGVIVQSDTFSSPMFRETFKRVFASRAGVQDDGDAPPVAFANSVHLEVLGSRDIKVMVRVAVTWVTCQQRW